VLFPLFAFQKLLFQHFQSFLSILPQFEAEFDAYFLLFHVFCFVDRPMPKLQMAQHALVPNSCVASRK
jgi:hypothetical protein